MGRFNSGWECHMKRREFFEPGEYHSAARSAVGEMPTLFPFYRSMRAVLGNGIAAGNCAGVTPALMDFFARRSLRRPSQCGET